MEKEFRRFECINELNIDALSKLKKEKDITHDDILLILQTVKINPCFEDISGQ